MTQAPEQFFADLLRAEPSRPLVTYYDEDTGERAELSTRSMANWVAKTHHLLVDGLGLGAGDTALLSLPAHWISVPALLGCLTAGLALTPDGRADVAFIDESAAVPAEAQQAGDVFTMPDEYTAAVRPQADIWAGVQFGAGPTDPCLPGLTRAQTADMALQRATELGYGPGARVLSTRSWDGPADWIDTLLAPLAVGGSVVYVAHCTDPVVLERRATQERATNRS